MSTFKIEIQSGNPAVFAPKVVTARSNDSIYWYNDDSKAHWPAPSASAKTDWLDYQIAPGGTSTLIALNPGSYSLNYVCALHPAETGQINVGGKKVAFATKTKKGAFAKNTKKGAFAKKTKG